MATSERPGVVERYEVASNTSDLTVDADQRGAVDVIIAAGWNPSQLGSALMRLHSAWQLAKPRRFTEAQIAQHAATLPQKAGRPDLKRARTEMLVAYFSAIKTRADRLQGSEAVREHLVEWMASRGLDPAMARPSLTYWLAPQCPVCDGLGRRKLPDAPVLGAACHHCSGSGLRARTLVSLQVLGYIEDAVNAARQNLKRRLHNS